MKMNGLDRTMTALAAMLLMCLPASAAGTADTASANGMAKGEKTEEQVKESTEFYNQSEPKPGSIAAKANMVKKYNEKHNK